MADRIFNEIQLRNRMFLRLRDYYKQRYGCDGCMSKSTEQTKAARRMTYQEICQEYLNVFEETIEQTLAMEK